MTTTKRRTVRANQLEARIERMRDEFAKRTTLSMLEFHRHYMEPMEKRILLLETIFGIRALRFLTRNLLRFLDWTAERAKRLRQRVRPETEED